MPLPERSAPAPPAPPTPRQPLVRPEKRSICCATPRSAAPRLGTLRRISPPRPRSSLPLPFLLPATLSPWTPLSAPISLLLPYPRPLLRYAAPHRAGRRAPDGRRRSFRPAALCGPRRRPVAPSPLLCRCPALVAPPRLPGLRGRPSHLFFFSPGWSFMLPDLNTGWTPSNCSLLTRSCTGRTSAEKKTGTQHIKNKGGEDLVGNREPSAPRHARGWSKREMWRGKQTDTGDGV